MGWDKLTTRRQIHRLTLYHKLTTPEHSTPSYISALIPHTRAHDTNMTLRNAYHHTQAQIRTTTHQRSFFSLTGNQWNQLPEATKQLSYQDFKKWIKQHLSTPEPPVYYSHGTKARNTMHTRLITDMSQLNAHMFKIQKLDSPACSCGHPLENTVHFIFSCPKYTLQRNILLNDISHSLCYNFTQESISTQSQILLHGTNLSSGGGRAVARHFQNYLQNSHRFTGMD